MGPTSTWKIWSFPYGQDLYPRLTRSRSTLRRLLNVHIIYWPKPCYTNLPMPSQQPGMFQQENQVSLGSTATEATRQVSLSPSSSWEAAQKDCRNICHPWTGMKIIDRGYVRHLGCTLPKNGINGKLGLFLVEKDPPVSWQKVRTRLSIRRTRCIQCSKGSSTTWAPKRHGSSRYRDTDCGRCNYPDSMTGQCIDWMILGRRGYGLLVRIDGEILTMDHKHPLGCKKTAKVMMNLARLRSSRKSTFVWCTVPLFMTWGHQAHSHCRDKILSFFVDMIPASGASSYPPMMVIRSLLLLKGFPEASLY